MLTQKEDFGVVTKQIYLIEHINRQNMPRTMAFSHSQAITYQGKVFAFADYPELERQDRLNISKRDLVSFDGNDWLVFS